MQDDRYAGIRALMVFAGAIAAALLIVAATPHKAKAADKGGMIEPTAFRAPTAVVHSWTGCAVGGSVGWVDAVSDPISNGIGLGSTGEKVGALFSCDVQMGAIVIGGEVGYNWMLGNLHQATNVQSETDVMGRVGVLMNASTLLYGHLDWSRLSMDDSPFSSNTHDGWKIGPGIEMRIANTPLSLDLRASYGTYNTAFTGTDIHTYDLMASIKYKFWDTGKVSVFDPAPLK